MTDYDRATEKLRPYVTIGGTDVTDYVQTVTVKRGRQRLIDAPRPGTCTLSLVNTDGTFDPTEWRTTLIDFDFGSGVTDKTDPDYRPWQGQLVEWNAEGWVSRRSAYYDTDNPYYGHIWSAPYVATIVSGGTLNVSSTVWGVTSTGEDIWVGAPIGARDHFVEVTVDSINTNAGAIAVRYTDPDNWVKVVISTGAAPTVTEYNAGSGSSRTVSGTSNAYSSTDTARVEVQGTTLRIYKNGVLNGTATLQTETDGRWVGMWGENLNGSSTTAFTEISTFSAGRFSPLRDEVVVGFTSWADNVSSNPNPIFTGFVESWTLDLQRQPNTSTVTLTALDGYSVLGNVDIGNLVGWYDSTDSPRIVNDDDGYLEYNLNAHPPVMKESTTGERVLDLVRNCRFDRERYGRVTIDGTDEFEPGYGYDLHALYGSNVTAADRWLAAALRPWPWDLDIETGNSTAVAREFASGNLTSELYALMLTEGSPLLGVLKDGTLAFYSRLSSSPTNRGQLSNNSPSGTDIPVYNVTYTQGPAFNSVDVARYDPQNILSGYPEHVDEIAIGEGVRGLSLSNVQTPIDIGGGPNDDYVKGLASFYFWQYNSQRMIPTKVVVKPHNISSSTSGDNGATAIANICGAELSDYFTTDLTHSTITNQPGTSDRFIVAAIEHVISPGRDWTVTVGLESGHLWLDANLLTLDNVTSGVIDSTYHLGL